MRAYQQGYESSILPPPTYTHLPPDEYSYLDHRCFPCPLLWILCKLDFLSVGFNP